MRHLLVRSAPFIGVRIGKRHHVRKDRAKEIASALAPFGIELDGTVELGEADDFEIVLLNGEPVAFHSPEGFAPTVRGLLKWEPESRRVTVDMGAVKFVYNGADVMAPGIVAADPGIEEGDLVLIDEEQHHKPLAVGLALMSSEEMVERSSGRAVESLHHVGDELWNLET